MAAGQKWLPWLTSLWALLISSGALPAHWLPGEYENSSSDALRFLSDYNSTAEEVFSFAASASWNYNANLTDYNSKLQVEAFLEFDDFSEAWGLKAKTVFTEEVIDSLPDPKDKVLIRNIKILGSANLQQNEREEYNTILSNMSRIYSTVKISSPPNVSWSLDFGLSETMAKSRSYNKLLFVWEAWHDAAGVPQKKLYSRFVELSNQAFSADGFEDTGARWRSWYESETFEQDMDKLYKTIKPLYLQLHAFVRRKLYNQYGSKYVNLKGPIPAHLLDKMHISVC